MLGSILSLVSALFFGLNNAAMRRGVLTGTALQGTFVSVPIGVPLFIVGTAVTGSAGLFWQFTGETYLLLVLAGIIHFTVGRYANMRATKAMGANFVRPVQQMSVLLAVVLAIAILDETLTALRVAGIVLVIAGPILMMPDRKKFRAKTEKRNARQSGAAIRFTPNFFTGFVFALISAAAFGTSPILLSAALSGFGPWAGVAGGVVAYLAATAVVAAIWFRPGVSAEVTSISWLSFRWFSASGVLIGISQMLRFAALAVAPVSVVTPILQTTGIFQVIFAWFLNRDHEPFGPWVLAGIFVSLLGAFALTLSTEIVIAWLEPSRQVREILTWTWP